tara:strand:- start:229 stop:396 length:168 start_codon:yes stop_codon:yes gene_type:complete
MTKTLTMQHPSEDYEIKVSYNSDGVIGEINDGTEEVVLFPDDYKQVQREVDFSMV